MKDPAQVVLVVEQQIARINGIGVMDVRIEESRHRSGRNHQLRAQPAISVQIGSAEQLVAQGAPATKGRCLQQKPAGGITFVFLGQREVGQPSRLLRRQGLFDPANP
jgi:hypothetical protein